METDGDDPFTLARANELLQQVLDSLTGIKASVLSMHADNDPDAAAVLRLHLSAFKGIFRVMNILHAVQERQDV